MPAFPCSETHSLLFSPHLLYFSKLLVFFFPVPQTSLAGFVVGASLQRSVVLLSSLMCQMGHRAPTKPPHSQINLRTIRRTGERHSKESLVGNPWCCTAPGL